MAFPRITEMVTYINRKLTGNDWNTNLQKIVNWLSLGDTDIKVKSVEADSIKYNGTTIVQNGNITTNTITANTVTANSFIGDGAQLTNIKAEIGFAYTPFAINSAKANFIINDTTKITFDVSEENPLIVTTAKGKKITITSINDYDVSNQGNGTYYIFVDEETNGGTVYLKTGTIWRQNTAPSMLESQPADIWLDTSCESYVCRLRETNNWYVAEYDKVPIAKVVINNGVIDSLETLPFNSNGTDVIVNGKYSDIMQSPSVVVKSYKSGTDWYRIWSDGWCEQGGRTTGGASGDYTVTFHQEMADTNYSAYIMPFNTNGASGQTNNYIKEYSATGMKISLGQPTDFCCWKVEGYIRG